MYSGYAFAAIRKTSDDDYNPTSGPGMDGHRYDDPKDDTSPEVTYAVTGNGPVYPFTPFTVMVKASDGKTAGVHGSLMGRFSDGTGLSYEVRSQSEWSSGSKTYVLGVRSCDRSKSGVTFSWRTKGKDNVNHTIAYHAGYMVPNIVPPNVKPNKTFAYTITFSSSANGSAIANNYGRWQDFGAEIWFEGWDGEKWERTNAVSAGSVSGGSASFSGTATAGDISGFSKIRLCVLYDGRDAQYDEATVQLAAVSFRACPSTLHVFGDSGTLTIFGEDLSLSDAGNIAISAETATGTIININDWLEDNNGNQLNFSTGWTIVEGGIQWTGQIRAKSSLYDVIGSGYANLTLKATYGASTAPAQIDITNALRGTITVPETVVQSVSFPISVTVIGGINGNLAVPRLPTEYVTLQGEEGFTYTSLSWSGTSASGNGEINATDDTSMISMYFGDVEIAYTIVAIQLAKSALVEAINERRYINGMGSSGNASNSDDPSTLRSKALSCRQNFLSSFTDATPVWFSTTNDDINEAQDTPEWYGHAYSRVCLAKEKKFDDFASVYRSSYASGYIVKYDSEYDGSHAAAKEAVIDVLEGMTWGSDSRMYIGNATGCQSSLSEGSNPSGWSGAASSSRMRIKISTISWDYLNGHCLLRLYGKSQAIAESVTFDKFGLPIPDKDVNAVLTTMDKPANATNLTGNYWPSDNPRPSIIAGADHGFNIKLTALTAEYDFIHK